MKSTGKRLMGAVRAVFVCMLALTFKQAAQAADSKVPLVWTTPPMTNVAYRESFESKPAWVTGNYNGITNIYQFGTYVFPPRTNEWFSTHTKALYLDTDGLVVTNTLLHTDDSAVTFTAGADPVYVDMRIRFETLTEAPGAAMLANSKLALFVEPVGNKLVVSHNGGTSTNSAWFDTNLWYQVTIKLYDGTKFDVLTNDVAVFTGLTVKTVGTANTLSAVNFYGTGLVDDLYVSHCNPATGTAISSKPLEVALPGNGANVPTSEQQLRINSWLAENDIASFGSGMSQDALSAAYLLNNLDGTTVNNEPYTLGIKKLEMISTTLLAVTVELKVDGVAKSGKINGKIQLQGKVNFADASWTVLPGAITPAVADFTGGEATYTFAIPAGGYKFFKPAIVP